MESNEWPLKTPVLGLRILQPEATCFLWLCTPAFLTERERPRMDPLMPPQGSILIPFSFSSLDPSFSRFSIHYQNYFPRKGKKRRPPDRECLRPHFSAVFQPVKTIYKQIVTVHSVHSNTLRDATLASLAKLHFHAILTSRNMVCEQ